MLALLQSARLCRLLPQGRKRPYCVLPEPKEILRLADNIIERKGKRYWLHFAVRPEGNRGKVTCVVK